MRDVASIEHRCLSRLQQTVSAMRKNVSECPQHHSIVAKKRFHSPDRLRIGGIESIDCDPFATAPGTDLIAAVAISNNSWHRKKSLELFRATAGTRAGTTATMRRRKSLMQIQVNYINAHISRPGDADQRVHVGAVHINQAAGLMNDATNFLDVTFEHAEGVRVRQHQSGNITVGAKFAQVFKIS